MSTKQTFQLIVVDDRNPHLFLNLVEAVKGAGGTVRTNFEFIAGFTYTMPGGTTNPIDPDSYDYKGKIELMLCDEDGKVVPERTTKTNESAV